ncbi:MAG: hypothetical protein ACE5KZ_09655 [Candidatus Scalinduaceae bacterium]
MNNYQRVVLYLFSYMLILLLAASGCQTTHNTNIPEPSVAELQSKPPLDDTQNTGHNLPQTRPVEKETTRKKSADKVTGNYNETKKRSLAELEKSMIGRWSNLMGHGGLPRNSSAEKETTTTEKSADKVTGNSDEIENESFVELKKNVIGKWMNLKETESLEFFDDGTILIGNEAGSHQIVRGYYKFVDNNRLKVNFGKGFYGKLLKPMSFKIYISENEITLTDEPDGAATTYKRMK